MGLQETSGPDGRNGMGTAPAHDLYRTVQMDTATTWKRSLRRCARLRRVPLYN